MVNSHGFDPERSRWSNDAIETLFPKIAQDVFNTSKDNIIYAWRDPSIEVIDTHYGIDILLKTPNRNVAIAARMRGKYYYNRFGDVTLRYDSLQTLGKMLEVQKSIARFLWYAWGNSDRPIAPTMTLDWHIIFLQRLVDKFLKREISFSGPFPNGDQSSRLIGFDIKDLQRLNLIYTSNSHFSINGKFGSNKQLKMNFT
jgi:hypothetical protein